jgi:hypothetical protein
MSTKEGGTPRPKIIGAAPPVHPKEASNLTDGDRTNNAREARLAAALRDNLRRRKAAQRATKDDAPDKGADRPED